MKNALATRSRRWWHTGSGRVTSGPARQNSISAANASTATHVLKCMDIWSGNQSVENSASTPGLEIAVYSRTYHGDRRGGDVHYVSLCAGGIVTRCLLADISGHGAAVAGAAGTLRSLMRRFMNSKRQTRLVQCLNREFTHLSKDGQFATAVVTTYVSDRNRFTLCNAGHPRPLWYRSGIGQWSYVNDDVVSGAGACNLPLGFDASAVYRQLGLTVSEGDILILYTDALTEARSGDDKMLGETGLHQIVAGLPTNNVQALAHGVVDAVLGYSGGRPFDDDATVLVLKFSAASRRTPGFWERLQGYAKFLGLKPT